MQYSLLKLYCNSLVHVILYSYELSHKEICGYYCKHEKITKEYHSRHPDYNVIPFSPLASGNSYAVAFCSVVDPNSSEHKMLALTSKLCNYSRSSYFNLMSKYMGAFIWGRLFFDNVIQIYRNLLKDCRFVSSFMDQASRLMSAG